MKKTNPNRMIRITLQLATASVLALSLGACTKQREYKEVYKGTDVYDSTVKSLLPTKEFIYVPSQLDSPHSVGATFPGWMGTERIVRFKFNENALVAETVVDDPRFADNTANNRPVVEIPVQHVDYRCADNGAGECSNREEEINDVHWTQKKSFKADVSGMKVTVPTLPIDLENAFGEEGCASEIGSRVVKADFSADVVQVEIEKTYRSDPGCVDWAELQSLQDLVFTVRHMHSFIARDKLISPAYPVVKYPQTDENTFGFFTTDKFKLSVDNRSEERGELILMNRWNPSRKTIPYTLSKNFDKPEMKAVKAATIEAVQAVNNAFKAAKVDLQIDLKGTSDVSFGDIRNNQIVLVEDPQATGVIGYGPSTADPRTGEIVSARTVMYLGTMKKFVRSTWDEIVDEERAKAAATEAAGGANNLLRLFGPADVKGTVKSIDRLGKTTPARKKAKEFVKSLEPKVDFEKLIATGQFRENGAPAVNTNSSSVAQINSRAIEKLRAELMHKRDSSYDEAMKQFEDSEDPAVKRAARLHKISKYNVYPAELINFTGAIKLANLDGLKDIPKVYWEELSEADQEKVIAVTLPFTWVPTLVHELGHNIGLRHNFGGSEDKANYYTKEEVEHFGHTHPMEFASIMDYGYKSLNELRVMGKYDVAALRYGYNREVEKTDGTIVKLPTSAEYPQGSLSVASQADRDALKEYRFCTDENVGINPGCRRFDEGTNYTEIAQHLVKAYNETYKRLNNRMGRQNFSDMNDGSYYMRIANAFLDMRPFFETYERIQTQFGIPENHPIWAQNEFLKDLKTAVLATRKAFIDPILVPSTTCVILNQASGEMEDVPMEALGGQYPSCFHDEAKQVLAEAGYVPVGQLGKSFSNQKYETSTNPYVDQIDVRGVWADKLLGANLLTMRKLGVSTFDKYTGNFLDRVGGTLNGMVGILSDFMLNEVTTEAEVTLANGTKTTLKEYTYSPFSTHMVQVPRSRGLRLLLNRNKNRLDVMNDDAIYSEERPFAELMLRDVLAEMKNNLPSSQARALRNFFGIRVNAIREGDAFSSYSALDVDGSRYFIHKKENAFAMGVVNMLTIVKTLDQVDEERLPIVLAAAKKAEGQTPDPVAPAPSPAPSADPSPAPSADPSPAPSADPSPAPSADPSPAPAEEPLSEQEKAAVALGSEAIEAYMNDGFQSASYYELVIKMLGRVNTAVTY